MDTMDDDSGRPMVAHTEVSAVSSSRRVQQDVTRAHLPGTVLAHGLWRCLLLWLAVCLVTAMSAHMKQVAVAAVWPCMVLGIGSTLWQLSWTTLSHQLGILW